MTQEKIDRALGYPYPLPDTSYAVHGGAVIEFNPDLRHGRTPVLAVGSNQSPEQIARKFPDAEWGPIACEKCTLADFDTVFSAHIAAYGSIAAALHPSPGTTVSLFVNWLSDAQLAPMHDTELSRGNYVFARLNEVSLKLEHGGPLAEVYFYRGTAGAFAPDGDPIPLAEVEAHDRAYTDMSQRDVQELLRRRTDSGLSFEQFILSSIDDPDARGERKRRMSGTTLPFPTHLTTVIET